MKETMLHVIAEYLDKEESTLTSSMTFAQMGLDSLDVMELAMQMEEEFDCKIELSQEIDSVDKLAASLEEHHDEKSYM